MEKEKFLELLLHFENPWEVTKVEENADKNKVDIYLDYTGGSKFDCPICNTPCTTYDSAWKTWRHLDLFEYETYIHARVPRVSCKEHGTKTVEVSWARSNSHFTLLFEDYVIKLAKMASVKAVAELVNEHDTRLWRIIKYYVDKCRAKANYGDVTSIGIDETSKKGHNYITVFVDSKTRKVLYTIDGKDNTTVKDFVTDLEQHSGDKKKITDVTCDMSLSFEKGIKENLPNGKITIDKFHVIKHLNESVNKVRIAEGKTNDILKKTKFIWLKNKKNLTDKQTKKMCELSILWPQNLLKKQVVIAPISSSRFYQIFYRCRQYSS